MLIASEPFSFWKVCGHMKKGLLILLVASLVTIFFVPIESAYTFTKTREEKPVTYYYPIKKERQFQLLFMHSIHKTDVVESYEVLKNNELRLLSMRYEDVAIGMPGYAEEGQTLHYENGVYTLSYDDATLPNFTLFIANIDARLQFIYMNDVFDLKEQLEKGHAYLFEVKKISLYEKMKGVKLYGKRKEE